MSSRGFFTPKEVQSELPVRKLVGCAACGLYKTCNSPKMQATGKGKKKILVIAEAPGKREDEEGIQLVGPAGKLLRRHLKDQGVDLDNDCRKINAVNCRPVSNKTPTYRQVECCRPMVFKEIEESKPKVIFLFGNTAIQSYLGHRWKQKLGGVTKWRGWAIPDREFDAWICPTYHPSFIGRKDTDDAAALIFRRDLRHAVSFVGVGLPMDFVTEDSVKVLTSPKRIHRYLDRVYKKCQGKEITFDYETTGLKPYKQGHKIYCCSICTPDGVSTAFPIVKGVKQRLRKILTCEKIGKVAANMKFEETWSRAILGCSVANWVWDTMLAGHVLDYRKGITGVKFQAFVRFGIMDYSSHITSYLKGVDNDANSFNRIFEVMDAKELLRYCAMDSLIEHRLSLAQRAEIRLV